MSLSLRKIAEPCARKANLINIVFPFFCTWPKIIEMIYVYGTFWFVKIQDSEAENKTLNIRKCL